MENLKKQGVDFFRPNFRFKPELRLLDTIKQSHKDAFDSEIGDRNIEGAYGVATMGFDAIPLKDLRATRKSNPEVYYAYLNGFKWLDDNWQEVSDFIGKWISSKIVELAKSRANDPAFADLTDAEFAQRAKRPKTQVRVERI